MNNSKKLDIDLERFRTLTKEIGELTRKELEGAAAESKENEQ